MTLISEKHRSFPLRGKRIYIHFEVGSRQLKNLEQILKTFGAVSFPVLTTPPLSPRLF